MSSVLFYIVGVRPNLYGKLVLKSFIKQIFIDEDRNLGTLTFIFCTDAYLLTLNQQFLQHDYFTDVLTFDYSESPSFVNGEIYISIERIKDNAKQNNTTYNNELHRIIFHGVLHLCGYKDKTEQEKNLMTKKENFYLKRFLTFHVETK